MKSFIAPYHSQGSLRGSSGSEDEDGADDNAKYVLPDENLWTVQRLLEPETTTTAHPRGPHVLRQFESNYAKECYQSKVAFHEDTGKHTMQDGYNYEQ